MKRLGVDDRSQKLKEQAESSQLAELKETITELEMEVVNLQGQIKSVKEVMDSQLIALEEWDEKYKKKEIETNELVQTHKQLVYKLELKINSFQNEIAGYSMERNNEIVNNENWRYEGPAIIEKDNIQIDNVVLDKKISNIEIENIKNDLQMPSLPTVDAVPKYSNQNTISSNEISPNDFSLDEIVTESRRGSGSMAGKKKAKPTGKSVLLQQVFKRIFRFLDLQAMLPVSNISSHLISVLHNLPTPLQSSFLLQPYVCYNILF